MTSIALPAPDLAPDTVSVVVTGPDTPSPAVLQRLLPEGWAVTDAAAEPTAVDVVVCPADGAVETARRHWPSAAVVAVAPTYDDGSAAVRALTAGADVCVRGSDPALVGAYLLSVARRRGLPRPGGRR